MEGRLSDGEAVVVLVDDNKARIAIQHEFDIDLMGTESCVTWMRDRFRMPNAENAWVAIRIAATSAGSY
jgi:hypothetical protein